MRSPELKTITTLLLILLLSFSILPITTTRAEETPEKAVTWNFTSTTQGWTGRNATARHSPDGGGRLYLDTFGNDPGVVSPNLSVAASSNDLLRMYIWSYCPDRDCHIYFKRSGSSTTFYGGYVYLSQGYSGGTYEVDMSGVADWTGTITQIRIDPSDYWGGAGARGFVALDGKPTQKARARAPPPTPPRGGGVGEVGRGQPIPWAGENVTSTVRPQL